MSDTTDFDVLIIGAGLSGIGAACHLVRETPDKSFVVLERRDQIGGTWDLFTYPGIRSDSDMMTFGYGFRPWTGTKVLADGPSIKRYVKETAAEYGVTDRIRFGRRVTRVNWSSAEGRWTVEADVDGGLETYTAKFLIGAAGYYNYDAGHRPEFRGEADFAGQVIHPQFWPADLDYAGKRVVVIGSGATAITLVPSMAPDAEHVTMLQRSPSYIMPIPADDPVSVPLMKLRVPNKLVYRTGRMRNIVLQQAIYKFCRRFPKLSRRLLLRLVRAYLGPNVDLKNFSPSYNPWDERLCVVPSGDLFRVLRHGDASIVTDHIERFTETGILLKSGDELPADLIVAATGLQIQLMGGVPIEIDGVPRPTRESMLYKGVMLDGVPNAMYVIGYTNASWTLKADMASEYFTRVLTYMDQHGYDEVVPVAQAAERTEVSVMGASMRSGYIQRGDVVMPRQGKRMPWQIRNDYFKDSKVLRHEPIADPALKFTTRTSAIERADEHAVA